MEVPSAQVRAASLANLSIWTCWAKASVNRAAGHWRQVACFQQKGPQPAKRNTDTNESDSMKLTRLWKEMYRLIIVLLRENDSLVRPQRIFTLNPHRLPLLQREKKKLIYTHTLAKAATVCLRRQADRWSICCWRANRLSEEPVVSFFFTSFIQEGTTANQARA